MSVNEVANYIANAKVSADTKNKLAFAYNWFAKTNGIQYTKPYFRVERKIPMIPTTENINKIIAAATDKFATIFTILAETGLEAHELATMTRKDIDLDRGIINALGCKGHNSRSFKLKTSTLVMLKKYVETNKNAALFPNTKAMSAMWRRFRDRLAAKLEMPQLKTIPMRNLRHYFATMKYDQTKDILLVKQLLGHKKLETTMFYTQLITFAEDDEYMCKTATNAKEAADLIEHGFSYIQSIDGLHLYRKRK
jgi:integrase